MKKIVFFIAFVIITILLAVFMSSNAFTPPTDRITRNINTEILFSAVHPRPQNDNWMDEYYWPEWLCAQQGAPMGPNRNTIVKVTGRITGNGYNGSPANYNLYLDKVIYDNDYDGTIKTDHNVTDRKDIERGEAVIWRGNMINAPDWYSLRLEVVDCPLKGLSSDASIQPYIVEKSFSVADAAHRVTVFSPGVTLFEEKGGGLGHGGLPFSNKYAATAYIMAECSNDTDLLPMHSYVNVAFWQALNNFNAYKQISTTLDDIDYKDDEYDEKDLRFDDIESDLEALENSPEETEEAKIKRTENASSLWDEALTFAGMWKIIDLKGGYGKGKTVMDDTDFTRVNVEFDASKNRYKVGPFRLNYLEKYVNGTMLCGMSALPKLKVGINNTDKVYEFIESAELKEKKGKFTITYEENRDERNIPSVYRNLLPHTKENFYLEFNYEEGLNAIKGIDFYFRYLDATCNFTLYKSDVQRVSWTAWYTIDTKLCYDCHVCSHGATHATSQQHIVGWQDTDEDGENDTPIIEWCTPSQTRNSHSDGPIFAWPGDPHAYHTEIRLHWEANVTDRIVDTQDLCYVAYARRWYVGSLYGKEKPDNDDLKIRFNWEIDLTTSLAGEVWAELKTQKDNNNIIGYYDKHDEKNKETGMKNVLVTVYIYQGTTKLQKAIMHDSNGKKISWPHKVVVDSSANPYGYYEFVRLEPPATNNKKNCFYVVEFEYDGQIYSHTLYLGDPGDNPDSPIANYEGDGDDFCRTILETGKTQYYSAVSNDSSSFKYKKSSMAVENYSERLAFDESFGEVTGNEEINDGITYGVTFGTDADGTGAVRDFGNPTKVLSYNEDLEAEDENDLVVSVVETPFNKKTVKENEPVNSSAYNSQFKMLATTFAKDIGETSKGLSNYQIELPVRQNGGTGARKWILNKRFDSRKVGIGGKHYIAEYMLHINLGLTRRPETDMSLLKDLYGVSMIVNEQKVTQPYSYLKEMDESDYDTMYQMLFDKKGNSYTLGLYSSDVSYQSYQRYQHAIDEVYNLKAGTELRLYATYVIRIYNNSDTNDVELNTLTDYYDSTFSLVDSDRYTTIVDEKLHRNFERVADRSYYRIMNFRTGTNNNEWKETRDKNFEAAPSEMAGYVDWNIGDDVGGMHSSTTETFTDIKLSRDEYIEIFTTYEVDFEGYERLRDEGMERLAIFGEKHNIAEISNYSTYYSEYDNTTYYSGYDNTTYYSGYSVPNVSGRIEKDSAPNNVFRDDLQNDSYYEDDTYKSLPLVIDVTSVERTIKGTVFNDKKTVDTGKYGIMTGDGKYKKGEDEGVPNVQVSMYEVINLGTVTKDISGSDTYNTAYDAFDYYYKVPTEFYFDPESDGSDPIVKTADDGSYHLSGFLAGDYVIRFDYGKYAEDGSTYTYNGQDYENTAFIVDNPDELNMKYLDLSGKDLTLSKGYSVARDNESRRMIVDSYSRTIENDRGELLRNRNSGNYQAATSMFAETPIMQIEVLDPKSLVEAKVGDSDYFEKFREFGFGFDNYEYIVDNINFGLEERAKTNITVEQYVNKIMMFKNEEPIFVATMQDDGTIVVNAPDATNLSKVSYIPHIEATKPTEGLYQQGFYSITVEDEFLNGLDLYLKYKIRVLNKSEVDFTGKLSNFYVANDITKCASQTPTNQSTEELIAWLADDYDIALGLSSDSTLTEIFTYNDSDLADLIARDNNRRRIQTAENQYGSGEDAMIYGGDSIRPQVIIYGKYVGRYYYQNIIDENDKEYIITNYTGHGKDTTLEDINVKYTGDRIVKTIVDQLVDYIDVDAAFTEDSISIDGNWTTDIERAGDGEAIRLGGDTGIFKSFAGILSKEDIGGDSGVYRLVNGIMNIYDNKDRSFVTKDKSNIAISYNERLKLLNQYRANYTNYTTYLDQDYSETGRREYTGNDVVSLYNSGLTRELVPESYKNNGGTQEGDTQAEMYITVSKHTSSDADANQLNFDNLVEVLVYSNTVGRRDTTSVPGNAMKIATRDGMWFAGYNSFDPNKTYDPAWKAPEDDAYAPEIISTIPPNGLPMRGYLRNYVIPITILIMAMIGLLSVFGMKQAKIRKNKDTE